jgi:septum formation protein
MLKILCKKYTIILGSASPRRKELLANLGLAFTIITTNKEEKFPSLLKEEEIAKFLAHQKASFLSSQLKNKDLLITADTIVTLNNKLLNKPKDKIDAFNMLSKLSNNTHKVITGVCIKTIEKEIIFSSTTKVTFKKLSDQEIQYYIENYHPLDKAGSYGIQDWIGKIGIQKIEGSYTNVVGLPLVELYENLKQFK